MPVLLAHAVLVRSVDELDQQRCPLLRKDAGRPERLEGQIGEEKGGEEGNFAGSLEVLALKLKKF